MIQPGMVTGQIETARPTWYTSPILDTGKPVVFPQVLAWLAAQEV
jgi:hypothetical protein